GVIILLTHAKVWPVVEAARPHLASVRAIVVVGDQLPNSVSNITRYQDIVSSQSRDMPPVQSDAGQLVALPYSSGTTGLPKGVMMTHRNLVSNHKQHAVATRMSAEDSYIVYMPLSHIYGMALMGMAVWSGAKQILLERFDLETVVRLIEECGVTWLFAVPPILLTLATAPGLEPSQFRTIKFVLSGAAPLAPELARRVEA